MAEAVDLTASAQLGVKDSVENAIQNVLGNTVNWVTENNTIASSQDIDSLEKTISSKFT